jgi:hypothetical protein
MQVRAGGARWNARRQRSFPTPIGLDPNDHPGLCGRRERYLAGINGPCCRSSAYSSAPHNTAYAELRIGGDPAPTPEDIATTEHIRLAGKILCIPVLDHLIVTRNPHRYHSMFERGTLPTVPE